eukprot:2136190-Rhodomonas_salina.2
MPTARKASSTRDFSPAIALNAESAREEGFSGSGRARQWPCRTSSLKRTRRTMSTCRQAPLSACDCALCVCGTHSAHGAAARGATGSILRHFVLHWAARALDCAAV